MELELLLVLVGLAAVALVIARRQRASLRTSELQHRTLIQCMNEGILQVDRGDVIVFVNDRLCEMLGYTRAELLGRVARDTLVFDEDRAIIDGHNLKREEGVAGRYELQLRHKSGRPLWVEISGAPVVDAAGTVVGSIGVHADITERRCAQEELARSQRTYQSLVDSIAGIVWEADARSFEFTFVSRRAEEILGYPVSRWLDEPTFWRDHIHPEDREWATSFCLRATAEGREHEFDYRMLAASGAVVWLHDMVTVILEDGQPAKLRGVMVDVTAQRNLEEQFRRAQRLEAVGRLAGGLAHDFSNVLTAIIGFAELLDRRLPAESPLRAEVGQIIRAGGRATALTRQLLAFGRQHGAQMRSLDLNRLVTEVEGLLPRMVGEEVAVATALCARPLPVRADRAQLEQAVINLAVNARDAMASGGTLTLETRELVLDEGAARARFGVAPGRYALLVVTDTGCGMSEETQRRLFEPFFTTKEPGKGTGLGLAMVYGVVQQSSGHIWVESEPGRGTSFTLCLPLLEAQENGSEIAGATGVALAGQGGAAL